MAVEGEKLGWRRGGTSFNKQWIDTALAWRRTALGTPRDPQFHCTMCTSLCDMLLKVGGMKGWIEGRMDGGGG